MEGLVAQGLVKRFRNRVVVDRVSVDIQRGEVVGLLGPNGAGKTTSFYMIVGLLRAEGGRIFLEGEDITDLPMYKRCRMGMGYLPQESSVFRKLTVEENLLAILETMDLTAEERMTRLRASSPSSTSPRSRAIGLHPLRAASGAASRSRGRSSPTPGTSSSTSRSRASIPSPSATSRRSSRGCSERGIGVLITDHNVRETLAITDRAYILYHGQILAAGTAHELAGNPRAREIYLGEKFSL